MRERLARLPGERYLAVDQTGVGRGVYELLGPLNPIGVTITSGDAVTRGEGRLEWRVPKRNLVAEMQVGLEGPTLKIAKKLPMAQTLVDELVTKRGKARSAVTFGLTVNLLAMRCPVYKQRDFQLGFDMELENLIGGGKGKGTSGSPARPKVPIAGQGRTAS